MKASQTILLLLSILTTFAIAEDSSNDLKAEHFQVKLKPNSIIPSGKVYSNHPSKIRYNKSRAETLYYEAEVRGRCPNSSAKLTAFRLEIDNNTVLSIPVSGNNRSLTGNNGNKWEAHSVPVNFGSDFQKLIEACNSSANEQSNNLSHDQIFNSNFTTNPFNSGKEIELYYHCEGGAWFNDIYYDTTALPLKALCEATGYRSILRVTESALSINPITGQDGTCKINLAGEFRTSYELYALRSNNPTAELRYRFKYQNASTNAYSQWWQKTANPLNGGAFVFNYTDRLPSNISGGKVSLEVEIDGDIYSSKAKSFNIDCVDALPLQQTQTLELGLAVTADASQTVSINGQLCPSHADLSSELVAGYPINGKMIIYGSTLVDIHVNPISLSANQSADFNKKVKLNWSNASNTLAVVGGSSSNQLKTQTLHYGMRVTNSNNEVVKSLDKKSYVISCQHPSVNPSLPGSQSLNIIPDDTGGGGAPTALTNKSPFNKKDKNKTVVQSGLRSDGELVQAKKGSNLLRHELTHTKKEAENTLGNLNSNLSSHKRLDTHDKLANQQTNHQKQSIPLENATISGIRSEQLNNKSVLYRGKLGNSCSAQHFPNNAITKQSGKQYSVICNRGKVTLNRTKKGFILWKEGDPVFTPTTPNRKSGPDKLKGGLGDEMPEDLPAG